MGLRRWIALVVLIVIPLAGFAKITGSMSGPYYVSCSNAPRGFEVDVTSLRTYSSSAMHIPIGSCPGW